MLCVPAARLAVSQVAVFAVALPAGNATAVQPLSEVPSAVKATLPVGALPVTVAVKITLAPTADGLPELVSIVVEGVVLGVHASTSVMRDHELSPLVTLTRMRSVVYVGKLTVRLTRLLPLTVP